jgi:septum formation protein
MKLYLASNSYSRRFLLEQSKISFEVIGQTADESVCDWGLPLKQLVATIAAYKMQHAVVPVGTYEGEEVLVLTADSLTQDAKGTTRGKPNSLEEAKAGLKAFQAGPARVATAFCLEKKRWQEGQWHTQQRIEHCVVAECVIDIPDLWVDRYYTHHPIALKAAGGIAVEGYGMQFLKSVHGSTTTIIGLPLYELREALEQLGFFTHNL